MYRFITTYSPKQYNVYARDLIKSVEKHSLPPPLVEWVFVEEKTLLQDEQLRAFLEVWADKPIANGIRPSGAVEYRLQAVRFAYKVFCYTNPIYSHDLDCGDWLIWLDADTVFRDDMTKDWLRRVCPPDQDISYIGRKDWDHSECGFIGIRMADQGQDFLRKMRTFYTEELMFGLPQWHDSFVFDRVRQVIEIKSGKAWYNLAAGIGGNHPWPETVLGEILDHYKGPRAKISKYGQMA